MNIKSRLRVAFNLMMASVVAVGSVPQAAFAVESVSQVQTVTDDTDAVTEDNEASVDDTGVGIDDSAVYLHV